ncbi:MAG: thymidylate synthase [Streptosporangiaceae bacterium]
MTPPVFATFTDAYAAVLSRVAGQHQYDIDTRGHAAREVLNVTFTLADPLARSPFLAARRTNIIFSHAEALWYLSGRDDLAMIGYYAPRLRLSSADGHRLTGTAYGPRLFGAGPDGVSQFDRALALLRADPDTKRAVLVVLQPGELDDPGNPDVSCATALHLMLRGGALQMTACMRANDALIGLACDVFCFTFILEHTARLLGVPVGSYTHHADSMHVNLPDLPKVRSILREARQGAPPEFPAEPMPAERPGDLAAVLEWEQALRLNWRAARPGTADLDGLHPYWQRVVALFEAYRQITRQPGQPVDPGTLDALDPGHRWLVGHRWPGRLPDSRADRG